jgi:hypothetical protein
MWKPIGRKLYLSEATIYKQFRPGDIAAVIRREKDHRPGNLFGCTEPAQGNQSGDHLPALLAGFRGSQQVIQSRCVDGAWAHGVHSNAASL